MAWILKTIRDLQLDPEPHVAVMPLGTGNDLSLSFGWGNTFLKSWINVSLPHISHRCVETASQPQRPVPVYEMPPERSLAGDAQSMIHM